MMSISSNNYCLNTHSQIDLIFVGRGTCNYSELLDFKILHNVSRLNFMLACSTCYSDKFTMIPWKTWFDYQGSWEYDTMKHSFWQTTDFFIFDISLFVVKLEEQYWIVTHLFFFHFLNFLTKQVSIFSTSKFYNLRAWKSTKCKKYLSSKTANPHQ